MPQTYPVPPSYRARAKDRIENPPPGAAPNGPVGAAPPLPRPAAKLRPRQEAFCEYFVATGNAAEAARKAGYSERMARCQGHRLLKDARVKARIRKHQGALGARIDPALILGRLENLYRLAERDGSYGSAARILVLQGRLMGFDYGGMAAYLISPRWNEERED